MTYSLAPQLAADCGLIGQTKLCDLLVYNHQEIPWFILVPRRFDVCEVYALNSADQAQLMQESNQLGWLAMQHFQGDKLNTGAIGNLVPQLHIHHVVRYRRDSVWPQPVWGNVDPLPLSREQLAAKCTALRNVFSELLIDR